MGYGDHLDDPSMVDIADRVVVPAHAHPEVLERADEVVGPNDTESIAEHALTSWLKSSSLRPSQ